MHVASFSKNQKKAFIIHEKWKLRPCWSCDQQAYPMKKMKKASKIHEIV